MLNCHFEIWTTIIFFNYLDVKTNLIIEYKSVWINSRPTTAMCCFSFKPQRVRAIKSNLPLTSLSPIIAQNREPVPELCWKSEKRQKIFLIHSLSNFFVMVEKFPPYFFAGEENINYIYSFLNNQSNFVLIGNESQ